MTDDTEALREALARIGTLAQAALAAHSRPMASLIALEQIAEEAGVRTPRFPPWVQPRLPFDWQ